MALCKILSRSALGAIFILISLRPLASNSIHTVISTDTTKPSKSEYKLNKKEFITTYGKDDSSKALIVYFFHKRATNRRLIYIPHAIFAGTALITIFAPSPISIIVLGIVILIALPLGIIGASRMIEYTRKNLARLLSKYNAGHSIPTQISTDPDFKKLLNSPH